METFLIVYVLPLIICVLSSWASQLKGDPDYVIAIIGFIPAANIAAAFILLVWWLILLIRCIVMLPTLLRSLFRK